MNSTRKQKLRPRDFPDYALVLKKWPHFRIPREKKPLSPGAVRGVSKPLRAEHGVVWSQPGNPFGYFGWPTIARMNDDTLVVVASGMRLGHACPYGRTVFLKSRDEGRTWSSPRVIHDSPLDDRDAGIVALGGNRLLLSWISVDPRSQLLKPRTEKDRAALRLLSRKDRLSAARIARARVEIEPLWHAGLQWVTDANASRFAGSWVRTSDDGGDTWGRPARAPVFAPHGPIRLRNGKLLYLGIRFQPKPPAEGLQNADLCATTSDDAENWSQPGSVPLADGTHVDNYHEPHAVELPSGKIIGLIRLQTVRGHDLAPLGLPSWGLAQTESGDGGRSWTRARPLGIHGSPPHLLRHSSGVLVCSYGYRIKPFGQRVALSGDEGRSWRHDYVLRDDGLSADLGYPSTVELSDGTLLTVYYQQRAKGEHPSLLYTRWELP